MALGDIYELKIIGHDHDGNQFNNVLHYVEEASELVPGTEFETAKILSDIWWGNNSASYLACVPSDSMVSYYTCRRLKPTGGPTYISAQNVGGTHAGIEDTIGICAVLRFIANVAGRGRQGRMFMPGIPVGAHTGNYLTGAYNALLAALNATLIPGIVSGGGGNWNQTVYSKKLGAGSVVVDWAVSIGVHTLRKRLLPRF